MGDHNGRGIKLSQAALLFAHESAKHAAFKIQNIVGLLLEDLITHAVELIDQDAELISDRLFGSHEIVGDAALDGGDQHAVAEESGMELKYLGWLGAELAASAFAQFINFSAGCGKCSVQPRVLRGHF